MKNVLITNDDGYMSEGIIFLTEKLREKYNVYVVAPDRERSAVSMGLTLNSPLRIKQISEFNFTTNGTPIDCVNLGIKVILPQKPDMIVSGINLGENVSEDIFYSGTVAAAFAGHLYNINSIAISHVLGKKPKVVPEKNLKNAVEIADKIIEGIINKEFDNHVYNLNIPYPNNGTVLSTYPNTKKYVPDIVENKDPRDNKYYWIGTGNPLYSDEFGTDSHAISKNYISLSKLKYDLSSTEKNYGEIIEQLTPVSE